MAVIAPLATGPARPLPGESAPAALSHPNERRLWGIRAVGVELEDYRVSPRGGIC